MEAMSYVLYLALLVLLVVVLQRMFGRKDGAGNETEPDAGSSCGTCVSGRGKCLQECALQNAVGEIEYFDDEELDRFRGRRADSYTADEASMFAEVMYTMKPEEVKDWLVSLGRRCVNLPDQLKDEAMMLMEG